MGKALIIVLAGFLTWAALYYLHWVLIRRRFVVISPGRVYQSGAMSPARLVRYARRHDIQVVVDFRAGHENGVQEEARALAAAGIRHVNIPAGMDPSEEAIKSFNDLMAAERAAGRRVLLHCKDGEGRAVAFAAIYRMELEGWSPRDAYRGATRLPPGSKFVTDIFPRAGLLSKGNCKTRLILNYRAATPAPSATPAIET